LATAIQHSKLPNLGGYTFEMLCVKNIGAIKHELGVGGVTTRISQWHESHAQIEPVIDRADNCIDLFDTIDSHVQAE
jgi:hypothetical protein